MSPVEAKCFNAGAIDELLREIDEFESLWVEYFNELRVNYLQLYYEDLARDPPTSIARALAFLGINGWSGICRSGMQRQADELTEEWVRRYMLERGPVRPLEIGATRIPS